MGQMPSRYTEGVQEKFHQLLSQHDFHELKLIYEYFKYDLIYIVEFFDIEPLLKYLASRNILSKEIYLQMKKDLGPFVFSEKLVQDIVDAGKEAVMGLWEAMYELHSDCSSSRVYTLMDELEQSGDNMMQQILLDRNGHPLTSELKELQDLHRQHLLSRPSTGQNQRFYISSPYMDIIVSHVRPFHRPSEHKLIETAIKHIHYLPNAPGSSSPDKLFCWCRRLKRVPHAVMVVGVPGIGKTTLLEKLVCDWANGKFYQRFSFVFFFRFRDLNRLENTSLESMILQEYPYLEGQLENILLDPRRVLFIFDGLDESTCEINFKSGQMSRDMKQVTKVGAVVVGLVKQSLLKGCSVLLTSQPDRLAGMDINIFKSVLEVIGLLPKGRQLYIERFFMNKVLSDKALGFLKENGVLYNFCYNPSYCRIICSVLSICFKPTNGDQVMPPLPKTLTQLFATFIADVLSSHSLDKISTRGLLTSIGWMAERGVMNHVNKFQKQTLSQYNVDTSSKLFPAFMEEYTSSPEASFSFQHPIVQEFLAALVHYIDYNPETLQRSLVEAKSFIDNRGELFLSILCGLADISTRTILEPHLGDLSSDAAKDVLTWLQEDEDIEYKSLEKRELLNVFFKFFELQNKEFASECLRSLQCFNFEVHLTPLDCSAMSFIVQSRREIEELCLNQSEAIEKLAPALHTIHILRFSSNEFGDDGVRFICSALKHPECKIHTLCLSCSGLTDRACSYLGPAIDENKSLRTLVLSHNRLEGPHFRDLMTALSSPTCALEQLYLDGNRLTDSSCSPLASGIRGNRSLKTLSLSFNSLTGPHFGDLMESLSSPTCTVEELMLQEVSLEDEYLPWLIPLSNNKNLTLLDLSHDHIIGTWTASLRELILQSSSLKTIRISSYHSLAFQHLTSLEELAAQKPGLRILFH